MGLWYISFADEDGFRGATVVEAFSSQAALAVASERGLNPGGQAGILPVPEPMPPLALSYLNRLVGEDELIRNGAKKHQDLPPERQNWFDRNADYICADHN